MNNKNYLQLKWESLSLVFCFDPPSIWKSGIAYMGEDYVSKNPAGFDLTKCIVELRNLMSEEDGSEWLVCLIKISALTQEIDIDFEYEDIKRWYLTPTMDKAELRAYAMSIK